MNIRMPRLLDGQLRERARLQPLSAALHLRLHDLSGAEMRLAADAPSIALRDQVELFDTQGSAGIYRVTAVTAMDDGTRAVRLEHTLATLADCMTAPVAFTGTVGEALSALLACQEEPRWTLGEVDVPEEMTVILATERTDVLSAVQTLLGLLPEGYALAFDQSVSPWVLHLRALSEKTTCEGRLNRSLQSVRYEQDVSRLCTRVYPFGVTVEGAPLTLVPLEGTDHLDSAAQGEWGVISRTFQREDIYDVPTLRDVAQRYLEAHAVPDVTVTAEAADISRATGETADVFRLGAMCRLALPAMACSLTLRITAVDVPDFCGAPGRMVLTLTNRPYSSGETAELGRLIRQATAAKLLGGTVSAVEDKNRAHGSYPSPVVHYFTVEDWAAVLDVRMSFTPDSGVSVRELRVDDAYPPEEVWRGGSFSAMPYLTRDELGRVAPGQHRLILHPSNGVYGEDCGVNSAVTMTVIEKKTTA